jgi:hypothetical protein
MAGTIVQEVGEEHFDSGLGIHPLSCGKDVEGMKPHRVDGLWIEGEEGANQHFLQPSDLLLSHYRCVLLSIVNGTLVPYCGGMWPCCLEIEC